MKTNSAFASAVLLGLAIAVDVAFGAPLTEQQLLKMKAAGISQDVIIQQIQNNGIGFAADPDAIIALKKAGLSDAVLSALSKLPTGPAAASPTQSAARMEQPPAQAQVDPCVAYEKELEMLEDEDEAMDKTCQALANRRPGDVWYVDHCIAENNGAIRSRIINFFKTNPNKCPAHDTNTFITPDGWTDNQYATPPNVTYRALQTLGPNDSKYSCAELKVRAWELADNVTQMDKSIGRLNGKALALNNKAQTSSQFGQLASVIGGSGAPTSIAAAELQSSVASQAASNVQQDAASIQPIRDSQQKRHDYLMQIYFQRRCDD
jgi:hypothetical protein